MFLKYNEIRKARLAGERGFTLVELLVVIVIIGILVAIAIPVFLSQRQGAQEKSIESDVRNGVLAMETYYAAHNAYPTAHTFYGDADGASFDISTGVAAAAADATKITVSPDVLITIAITANGYTVQGTHTAIKTSYIYDSSTGATAKGNLGPAVPPTGDDGGNG